MKKTRKKSKFKEKCKKRGNPAKTEEKRTKERESDNPQRPSTIPRPSLAFSEGRCGNPLPRKHNESAKKNQKRAVKTQKMTFRRGPRQSLDHPSTIPRPSLALSQRSLLLFLDFLMVSGGFFLFFFCFFGVMSSNVCFLSFFVVSCRVLFFFVVFTFFFVFFFALRC